MTRLPGIGLTKVGPNSAAFFFDSLVGLRRERSISDGPVAPPSIGLAAQVALDETLLGIMRSPKRHPQEEDYTRVAEELVVARELYESKGWLDRPGTYHRMPPLPEVTQWKLGSTRGLDYE